MTPQALDPAARRMALSLAAVGTLSTIDTTATVVALPAMVADLGTTLPRGAWMTTGYLLGLITAIPLSGWLARRFGDRRVYLTGLGVFIAASVGVGAAPNVELLIGLRLVQGFGGGVLNPIAMAIAQRSVPPGRRGQIMSLLGLSILVGPVLGPPFIGALVDAASWRWAFWINLPLGLVGLTLCSLYLPVGQRGPGRGPFDWIGLCLVVPGSAGLIYALTGLGESGRLTMAGGLVLSGAAVALGAFAWRCLRVTDPLLQLRVLARPGVASGALVILCYSGAFFGAMVIVPTFVQAVRGDPVSVAGALVAPGGVAVGVALQVATRLVDRTDARRVVIVGLGATLVGMAAMAAALALDAPYLVVGAVGVIVGIGSGATWMPTMVASVRDLSGAELPDGVSLLNLLSQLGAALGNALVATTITLLLRARVASLDGAGVARMMGLAPTEREAIRDSLASAVGLSYATPLFLVLVALVACAWRMRRRGAEHPTST